jgi:hypothetical protein
MQVEELKKRNLMLTSAVSSQVLYFKALLRRSCGAITALLRLS